VTLPSPGSTSLLLGLLALAALLLLLGRRSYQAIP
jgi:hypothetical protein